MVGNDGPDYKVYDTHTYAAKDAEIASAVHDWVGKIESKTGTGWSFKTDSFLLRRLAHDTINDRFKAFSKKSSQQGL